MKIALWISPTTTLFIRKKMLEGFGKGVRISMLMVLLPDASAMGKRLNESIIAAINLIYPLSVCERGEQTDLFAAYERIAFSRQN